MNKLKAYCLAGSTALLLAGALPARAQMFFDDGFDGPPPPHHAFYGAGYGAYAPPPPGYYGGYEGPAGGYVDEDEVVIDRGYTHRRCRAHKACYTGRGYDY